MNKLRIGIIGYGFVGQAVEYSFMTQNTETFIVDPKYNEELEAEANQQYGIKPVPFQVAGRYEAAVVNSYFHILIKYGDQYVTLSFDDLIEVKSRSDGQLDVSLRNLEYDLTKSIKKVVYGFQSLATIFAENDREFTLISIITPESLPDGLKEIPFLLDEVVSELQKESSGKLHYEQINADLYDEESRDNLNQKYNITPLAFSLFAPDSFYMHLILGESIKLKPTNLSFWDFCLDILSQCFS